MLNFQFISFVVLAGSTMILGGCMSPEQLRAADEQRYRQERADQERRQAEYDQFIESRRVLCARYGFQTGTDAFARCVQQEISKAQADSQRAAAVASCKQAMFLRPKKTPHFSESYSNAAKCDADPQAHLREETTGTRCVRNIDGSVTCRPE